MHHQVASTLCCPADLAPKRLDRVLVVTGVMGTPTCLDSVGATWISNAVGGGLEAS